MKIAQNPLALRKSIWPLIIKASGTFFAFILSITLARILGLENFGAYSLVVSAIMVMSIPIQSGIPTLATRETSKSVTKGDNSTIKLFLGWSNKLIIIFSLATILLTIIAFVLFPESQFPGNLLIAISAVVTISLTLRNSAILRGLGLFKKGVYLDAVARPLGQLIILALVWLIVAWLAPNLRTILATFAVSSFVAFLFSYIWLRNELIVRGAVSDKNNTIPKEWQKGVMFLTVAGGGQVLFGNIDTLMLGAMGREADVGAYRVAVQLSMLLIFILTVANQLLQPKFAQLFFQKDIDTMQKLAADSSLMMFFAGLVPGLLIIFLAAPLLHFFFGESYTIAATALQILAIGQIINVLFGSVGTILNMSGMEKEAMTSVIIAIGINFTLDIVLIPLYGATGAALASAISIVIWNGISRYYVVTRVGIDSSGIIYYIQKFIRSKKVKV